MVKEAYVSFEVAKLLKAKSFPQDTYVCNTVYKPDGKMSFNARSFIDPYYICKNAYIFAPTHQMALSWLREEHGIHIEALCPVVDVDVKTSGVTYNVVISNLNNYCLAFDTEIEGVEYNSYEDAIEAALKYTLTKLI